jgi:hypothetical protein
VNDEFESKWKKVVVVHFRELLQGFRWTEENHKNLSVYKVSEASEYLRNILVTQPTDLQLRKCLETTRDLIVTNRKVHLALVFSEYPSCSRR